MVKKIKLKIQGMHCASCASNVERALKKVRGIKSATVSLMTNKCFVECEDNADVEEMKKVVDKMGYKVVGVE